MSITDQSDHGSDPIGCLLSSRNPPPTCYSALVRNFKQPQVGSGTNTLLQFSPICSTLPRYLDVSELSVTQIIRETHWKSIVAIRSLRTLEVASLIFSGTIITGKSGAYLTCTDLSTLIFEMDLTRKLQSDQIRSVHVRSIAIVLSETFNDSGDG